MKNRGCTFYKPKHGLLLFLILITHFFLIHEISFAQNSLENAEQKQDNHFIPYRGRRMSSDWKVFFVTEIETEYDDDDEIIEIEIKFNAPYDLRTLQKESILINGTDLPEGTTVEYNKRGTKLEIKMSVSVFFENFTEPLQIEFLDVKSFNGLLLERVSFENIRLDSEYAFFPPRQLTPSPNRNDTNRNRPFRNNREGLDRTENQYRNQNLP